MPGWTGDAVAGRAVEDCVRSTVAMLVDDFLTGGIMTKDEPLGSGASVPAGVVLLELPWPKLDWELAANPKFWCWFCNPWLLKCCKPA